MSVPFESEPRRPAIHFGRIQAAALIVACTVTGAATYSEWLSSDLRIQSDLDGAAREVAHVLRDRLTHLEVKLHTARAFLGASDDVDLESWEQFVRTGSTDFARSGAIGIALIDRVPRSEVGAWLRRWEHADGRPHHVFDHPFASDGDQGDLCVIRFHAPIDLNGGAIGFNVASVPQSRTALQRSAATNAISVAEAFPLIQDVDGPLASAVFLPIYNVGEGAVEWSDGAAPAPWSGDHYRASDHFPSSTESEASEAVEALESIASDSSPYSWDRVRGWVGIPVHYDALLAESLASIPEASAVLVDGDIVVNGDPVFDSRAGRMESTQVVPFAGRELQLAVRVAEPPLAASLVPALRVLLIGSASSGFVLSLIAFAFRSRRRADELELRVAAEREHKRMLESEAAQLGSIGAWQLDIRTGRVDWSDEVCRIHDLPVGQVPTLEEALEFYKGEARTKLEECLRRAMEEDQPWEVELPILTSKGRTVWTRSLGRADRRDGEVVRIFGSFQDITAIREQREAREAMVAALEQSRDLLRQRAEELEEARAQSEAASRAKSEFLANMSHEIRTPMGAILGYAELMLQGGLNEEETGQAGLALRRNSEQLIAILDDVLDLSKIEVGELTIERHPLDPRSLVDDVVALYRRPAEDANIELEVEHGEDVPLSLECDVVRLRQIVSNLVGNAVKFTQEGAVTIRTSARTVEEGLCELTIEVTDTGIGIEHDMLEKVFDAFTQGDGSLTRRFGGTGLGLSISARLARLLGGDVTATSEVGVGSRFVARIRGAPCEPAFDCDIDSLEPLTPRGARPGDSPLAGMSVLLAEDGADNRRLISLLLTRAGAAVELAENGRQAIERFEAAAARGAPPHVILMDMQMPEIDGYEASRILRARGETVSIVALTAHAMQGDRERCIEAGCDDYLTKPIDRRRLVETILRVATA
ncbi:Autoinducer 2 sensor kinase/phosphatase LuxQ [Planctomycetes bacterium Pla163]|uniref:histidine kinase n=1 Tax=Rohdeia mirabilis TaxID=2528008 RepID=A0A518CX39_9BACT|nr:Autoinducer 2 sensor kinase/phosphatase LuxQ [Planctomycetes bacterium Pla163]